ASGLGGVFHRRLPRGLALGPEAVQRVWRMTLTRRASEGESPLAGRIALAPMLPRLRVGFVWSPVELPFAPIACFADFSPPRAFRLPAWILRFNVAPGAAPPARESWRRARHFTPCSVGRGRSWRGPTTPPTNGLARRTIALAGGNRGCPTAMLAAR